MKNIEVGFAYAFNITYKDIANFIKQNWIRETLLSTDDFYEWQFIKPPHNNNKDHSIVAMHDKKIIGFLGAHKRDFFLEGEILNGAELTTWIIDPEYQGHGIAKRMLDVVKSNFGFALGANITKNAIKVYLKSGFNYINEIPRFIKIINFESVSALCEIDPSFKNHIQQNISSNTEYTYQIQDINMIPVHPSYNGFDMSNKNLKWRFIDHQIYDYKSVLVDSGNTNIIYRIENVDNVKVMTIVDILSSIEDDIYFKGLDAFAIDNNIDLIEYYSLNRFTNNALQRDGFISTSEYKSFIKIPFLYNPIEIKDSLSYSLIYYISDTYKEKLSLCNHLHITKSNCDLDRPNHSYMQKINCNKFL